MKRRWKIKRDLYGLQTMPSAGVWAHVCLLKSRGMTLQEISSVADVATSTLARIRRGEPCYRSTAGRLLAVPVPPFATSGRVYSGTSTVGAQRRLQALATLGWSTLALSEHTTVSYHTLRSVYHKPRVMAPTHTAIMGLYDRFWNTPAPPSKSASLTATNAHANGWVGPLAWDDDDLDNPDATPNVSGAPNPRHTNRVHVEDVEWLLDLHPTITTRQVADRLGVGPTAVWNHLKRKGHRELLDVLKRNAELAGAGNQWHGDGKAA